MTEMITDGDVSTRFYVEVDHLLRALRTYLELDVAFVSRFCDGRRIFEHVDCAPGKDLVQVGASDPLDDSYCHWVVEGKLPRLITDCAKDPFARTLPVTAALPVGAHLGVPLELESGEVYGTICCFSLEPDETLSEADLHVLESFSRLIAKHITNLGCRALSDLVSHGADTSRLGKPRFRVLLLATLVSTAAQRPVKLRNISTEEALVEGQNLPAIGTDLFLRRGEVQAFASIVWRDGNKAGLQFENPLSNELLHELIHPPRASAPAMPPRETFRWPGLCETRPLAEEEFLAGARWAQLEGVRNPT